MESHADPLGVSKLLNAGDQAEPEDALASDVDPIGYPESERRLRTLTDMVSNAATATRPDQVCALAIETLTRNWDDLTFVCFCLYQPGSGWQRVAATPGTPARMEQHVGLCEVLALGKPLLVDSGSALIVPLLGPFGGPTRGVLIVGLSHEGYRNADAMAFFAQVGRHVGSALAIAAIHARSEKHLQILELQDQALQAFFAIGLRAHAALADVTPSQRGETMAAVLGEIIEVATSGRQQLREAMLALGRAEVDQRGLVEVLQSLARSFRERTGIDTEVIVTGRQRDLPSDAVETLHHAAAEALADIERHARATAVVLSLHMTRRYASLNVHDDDIGAAARLKRIRGTASYVGLRGVAARVRRLGGTFTIRPSREAGFLVRARLRLPLKTDPS